MTTAKSQKLRRRKPPVAVATKNGRIRAGKVVPADESIRLAQSTSGDGADQMLWYGLDSGRYEIRFERSPFNDKAAPETFPVGVLKTVSDKVPKGRYKYSVYVDGKLTHDPDVVVV